MSANILFEITGRISLLCVLHAHRSLSEKGYDACTSACAEKKTPPGLFTSLHEVALNVRTSL